MKFKSCDFYVINKVARPQKEVEAVGQSNHLLLMQLFCAPDTERWTKKARFLLSWSSHLIATYIYWVLTILGILCALSHFYAMNRNLRLVGKKLEIQRLIKSPKATQLVNDSFRIPPQIYLIPYLVETTKFRIVCGINEPYCSFPRYYKWKLT